MVLQVLADAARRLDDGDAVGLQQVARAYAGQLQQLGRIDRAAAQDHFGPRSRHANFTAVGKLDPDRAAVFNHHFSRQSPGDHGQILAPHRRVQIGDRRRAALAILDRQLVIGSALLRRPIDVVHHRQAHLAAGLQHRVRDRMMRGHIRHVERTALAVTGQTPPLLMFRLEEIGQAVVKGPALAAQLTPTVIIRRLTAHIEKAVDRGRTAQHLAARPAVNPPAGGGIGLCLVEPVDLGIVQRGGVADRHMDREVGQELGRLARRAVVAARLKHDDLELAARA